MVATEPVRPPAMDSTVADAPGDEAHLVARAQLDRAAFAPLYDRYVDRVYAYCSRRLATREEAEDATAQIFAKALAALPACHPHRFRSWLFAIAHNTITDGYRTRHPAEPLATAGRLIDRTPGPAELAETADTGRVVRSLLVHLPTEQARVVELRLAGLTGPEIARVMGRSHGAVKAAQFRAYARLRELLVAGESEGGRDATR